MTEVKRVPFSPLGVGKKPASLGGGGAKKRKGERGVPIVGKENSPLGGVTHSRGWGRKT